MPLHHTIARESPASRRWRWCAPLLLAVGLIALALTPGVIFGDRPYQVSLCGAQEGLDACVQEWRARLAERAAADLPEARIE